MGWGWINRFNFIFGWNKCLLSCGMQFYFSAYTSVNQMTSNNSMLHINSYYTPWKAFRIAHSIHVVRFASEELKQSQILMKEHNKRETCCAPWFSQTQPNSTLPHITRVWLKHADFSHIFSSLVLWKSCNKTRILPKADYEKTTSPWNKQVFRYVAVYVLRIMTVALR